MRSLGIDFHIETLRYFHIEILRKRMSSLLLERLSIIAFPPKVTKKLRPFSLQRVSFYQHKPHNRFGSIIRPSWPQTVDFINRFSNGFRID